MNSAEDRQVVENIRLAYSYGLAALLKWWGIIWHGFRCESYKIELNIGTSCTDWGEREWHWSCELRVD
jgi:hypothetical protein